MADIEEEARILVDKGELKSSEIGKWVRKQIALEKDTEGFQDESVDETEEQPMREPAIDRTNEPIRKMNKMQILLAKSLTFIKQSIVFLNNRINSTYLLGFVLLVLLLLISQQLSEIKKELRIVVLVQKQVHPEQDSQIGLLTSEQQEFALLSPKEQIEKWNKMSSSEKSSYADMFYDKISAIDPDVLGLTQDEYNKLLDDADDVAGKNPKK